MKSRSCLIILAFAFLLGSTSGEQCGRQANGALCPNNLCCSQYGWCGDTDAYCKDGCQSQCRGSTSPTPPSGGGSGTVGSIITESLYNQMLKYSTDSRCPSNGFYTYNAFITAAQSFPDFGTTGDDATRKRELAAFFGQTSHETTGGWASAPDGPYAWGYCFIREINQDVYCTPSDQWPCVAGQKYYGRGPMQLTHNYNYGPAGNALSLNLLSNPDLVATNAIISFKAAIWFWMTPQGNKPSCHNVITGNWQPSGTDNAAGRVPGYGVITNIINGGLECGHGPDSRVEDRIGFYKRYCDMLVVAAEQCGRQANGALCPNNLCCSQFGFCGDTDDYCKNGCQSQCRGSSTPTPSGGSGVGSIISESLYNQMLKYSRDSRCPSNGFYTYNAFITAARFFPAFGNTGSVETRKREVAAFFGQTSHETTGGWPTAPDGPYAWGYCFIRERNQQAYCTPSQQWPCASGQQYYGRGPIQLTHNYNYGPAGNAIGAPLLASPDLVATDAVVSFKTALWFWMTAQGNKPSCHNVITGNWQPSSADNAAGRSPGYGVITNIINGGLECGHGPDDRVKDRIGFYKRYCDMLGIGYGNNLDCYNQRSF